MATRTIRVDDLTGETLYGDGTPTRFELEGVEYEIDLTPANEARLREAFAPFVDAAVRSRRAHYRRTALPRSEPKKNRPRN